MASGLLSGKTVVVTGSSSGMGRATAVLARAQGAHVIGVDRTEDAGHVDRFIAADLSTCAAADRMADALPEGIDGLANIAGLPPTAPPRDVLAVNFTVLRHLTERLVPRMTDGGSVVNLASLAGHGWPRALEQVGALIACAEDGLDRFVAQHGITGADGRSYFLSKEALVVWTMQNRWTWRDRGIRMNAVSPGPVETPILPDFLATLGDRPSLKPGLMDRFGTPDDVAPVVVFLLSDLSRWIRGANIPADGGMETHMTATAHGL